ncbi:hypothetical protein SDJN03_12164, partial [Cucurbita argyrosperma subsp. sororia]
MESFEAEGLSLWIQVKRQPTKKEKGFKFFSVHLMKLCPEVVAMEFGPGEDTHEMIPSLPLCSEMISSPYEYVSNCCGKTMAIPFGSPQIMSCSLSQTHLVS